MNKLLAFLLAAMNAAHAAAQDGCVRGEPTPLFPRAAASSHSFAASSATEAIETMRLKSGATLRVEHGGCEYYVVTIEFAAPSAGTSRSAYTAAAKMLAKLRPLRPDSNFDLARAAATLREMARSGQPLNVEQAVAGDGVDFLQARLTLERANGKLRLRMLRGPL